jgi:heme A synthase
MRIVYKVLAYTVAVEVALQASFMVLAIAGLGSYIDKGGVFDKASMENDQALFPEAVGFMLHGINGSIVIPVLALALLIVSFFARIPRGVRWAVAVFLLVVLQANLGFAGHELPFIGALHGLNALLLFTVALLAARRATAPAKAGAAEESGRVSTTV